ncbi:MAG: AMP phosphorylase [Candidatus Aenigmarchaeota archaeon]|nr:AMP phosphorylase [Candidatus Aenigmarchaeota archaeon]
MRMKVRHLQLSAGGKMIGIVNEKDAAELGVHPLDKVVLTKGSKKATITLDTTKNFVRPGTILLYDDVKEIIKTKSGESVQVEPRKPLVSKLYIRKKTEGGELTYVELRSIIDDVIARNLNDLELASFVTALHINGLTLNESIGFSKAMIETGKKIKFPGIVCDKHSVGGVPGDKTSMIVVPIIAAAGLTIPKTSSRSITSPSGTADRMEILAPVDLHINEIKKVVAKTKGCLVWGGSVDLAPADDLFIRIEHPLGMDPLLLPSVMSKKKSVGCRYLVIDIPAGEGAKIRSREEAEKLAKDFIAIGRSMGIKVDCAVTRGDQPVGYAIGPALEAREALSVLGNDLKSDVLDKATSVAGILLGMAGKGNKKIAELIVKSGKAERKLREIIEAQGGDPKIKPDDIDVGPFKFNARSKSSGVVSGINNTAIVDICRAAGTPKDRGAGILLNKKINDSVKKGEVLFTIFAEKRNKLNTAVKEAKTFDVFNVLSGHRKMLVEKI